MSRIEKISALLGDVALPLFGYFFWNWNFYFILLFFMLDQISRVVFLPQRLKLIEIPKLQKTKIFYRQFLLLVIELFLIHVVIHLHQGGINFIQEFLNFLTYKEMGISQGIILIPVIIASEWMRIKNELKMGIIGTRQLGTIELNKRNSFLRISFFAFLIGLQFFIVIPELALMLSFFGLIIGLVFY
jgi:hypothetical protein